MSSASCSLELLERVHKVLPQQEKNNNPEHLHGSPELQTIDEGKNYFLTLWVLFREN